MNASEWIERFAGELGSPAPAEDDVVALLELAATAAHSSERIAAPIACYLAGRAGIALDRANEIAALIGAGDGD